MSSKNFKWILYIIILVIACTIAIQVYWNYKNYESNKQQLINDVQVSLDNAVDSYYENLAKKNTLGFALSETKGNDFLKKNGEFETIIEDLNIDHNGIKNIDSIDSNSIEGITILRGTAADSMRLSMHNNNNRFPISNNSKLTKWMSPKDSSRHSNFEFLTSKVVISITNDSLKLKDIDSLLRVELSRKTLNLNYGLSYKNQNREIEHFNTAPQKHYSLSTVSKSSFLPIESVLSVHFKNETKIILKRIFSGVLISSLLVLAVIACLFYLLKIINHQKQLAEVKNDLISNITHEFKTPIATIGVALESIKNFNVINDKAKTEKYLDMSNSQLSKLNIMVEKLLETASLDSENLNLNIEEVNLNTLIQLLVEKYKIQTQHKTILFSASSEDIMARVDAFHFENAINNITDNAVKYGGDTIEVNIIEQKNSITILISDNGNNLTKAQANQIFEKFYRVPKGNTHDVKGFGIGLYYTKKIIEKHSGNISISLNNGTAFKITIPNE